MMPNIRPLLNLAPALTSDRLRALPLVVLYITDGCNSRCATCDIWKLPRRNMAMSLVERLAEEFHELGVRQVVLSGREQSGGFWATLRYARPRRSGDSAAASRPCYRGAGIDACRFARVRASAG